MLLVENRWRKLSERFLASSRYGNVNPTSPLAHPISKNRENEPSRKLFSQHRLPDPPPITAKDRISHAQENIVQNLYPGSIPHSGVGGISHRVLIGRRQLDACRARAHAHKSADGGSCGPAYDSSRTANRDSGSADSDDRAHFDAGSAGDGVSLSS